MLKIVSKVIRGIIEIGFAISIVLLGKFKGDLNSFMVGKYQIVVTVFWMCGVFIFMGEREFKAVIKEVSLDFLVALFAVPLWYRISGDFDNDLYQTTSVIVHFVLLMVVIYIVKRNEKLIGKFAYYSRACIPVVTLFFIKIGVPIVLSVVIAVLSSEMFNFLVFLNKNMCRKDSKREFMFSRTLRDCEESYLIKKENQYADVALKVKEVIQKCNYKEDEQGSFELAKTWILNNEMLPMREILKEIGCGVFASFANWIPIIVSVTSGIIIEKYSNNSLDSVNALVSIVVLVFGGFLGEWVVRSIATRIKKFQVRILEEMTFEQYRILIENKDNNEL